MRIYAGGFEKFIKDYEKLVFSICFSFTKNYFDAEDLTQETFISAYRFISGFDGENPKAWVSKIAVNKCKNHLKSPKNRLTLVDDDMLADTPSDSISPEGYILENEQSANLYNLCSRLKEPYKTIAVKYFCEDVKLSEYSMQSGTSIKTLETQLYRAKKKLSALWKEEQDATAL